MSEFKFKKNYLKEVIFKVDFRNIQELIGFNANPEKFVNIIKDEFSKSNDVFGVNKIQPSSNYPESENIGKTYIWTFCSKDDSKLIELTKSSIAISYKGIYYKSHDLLKDIQLIIDTLTVYEISTVNKIGLRYINEISPNENINNWADWINPILHNFNPIHENLKLMRSLTQSEYKIGAYKLDFIYGQFNSNYPDINIENNYILDYDCYTSSSSETSELTTKFMEMHDIIKVLFQNSIGKDLIKDLIEG